MSFPRAAVAVLIALSGLHAQEGHGVTPADIQRGSQIFLNNCERCHGPNGDAVTGVNLASNRFRHARSDAELIEVIRKGIPGTPMPPGNYTDDQAGAIVAYLHAMSTAPRAAASRVTGDPVRGRAIVMGKGDCLTCHRLGEAGGFTGPDLTAIGGGRRPPDFETSLVDPAAEIRDANRPVRVVTADGTVVNGTLLNYDSHSLQMMDTTGRLRGFPVAKLRGYELLKISPMPSYKNRLSAAEIADVVAYLSSLKGQTP